MFQNRNSATFEYTIEYIGIKGFWRRNRHQGLAIACFLNAEAGYWICVFRRQYYSGGISRFFSPK